MKPLLLFVFLIASLKGFSADETPKEPTYVQELYYELLTTLPKKAQKRIAKKNIRYAQKMREAEERKEERKTKYKHLKYLHCINIPGSFVFAAASGSACYDAYNNDFYMILGLGVHTGSSAGINYGFMKFRGATGEVEGKYMGVNVGLSLGGTLGYSHYQANYDDKYMHQFTIGAGIGWVVNGGVKGYKVIKAENYDENDNLILKQYNRKTGQTTTKKVDPETGEIISEEKSMPTQRSIIEQIRNK